MDGDLNMQDKFVDHEIRIRNLEEFLKQIHEELRGIREKMDNQYNLIIGAIITSFVGVALHMAKLL